MPGREEDDPVHRRMLLLAAGLAGTSLAGPHSGTTLAGEVDPAALLAHQLGDVLLGPDTAAEPVVVTVLRDALIAAQRDFSTCQYVPLASRLPALIAAAEVTAAQRGTPDVHQVLAETYILATRALIKLEASGLEWISADRGPRAAPPARSAPATPSACWSPT
jgi:hypothetical protein